MEQAIKVTDINSEDVDLLWPQVEGYLQAALASARGEFSIEDIHLGLITGLMKLWIAYDNDGEVVASAVCEIRHFPRKRVCYVVLMSGEGFANWSWALNCIEDWARETGADAIASYVRKGLVKPMKEYGYEEAYTVVQKELTERRLH